MQMGHFQQLSLFTPRYPIIDTFSNLCQAIHYLHFTVSKLDYNSTQGCTDLNVTTNVLVCVQCLFLCRGIIRLS